MTEADQLTQLIQYAIDGDANAREQLLPMLYQRLLYLARAARKRGNAPATLSTTALVHELYLDVFGADRPARTTPAFASRHAFFSYASKAMQNMLTDNARRYLAQKRGAGAVHDDVLQIELRDENSALQLLALDAALTVLRSTSPRVAEVVELKFFAGLAEDRIADLLNVDARTVRRDWQKARAYILLQFETELH
jgi:RNA polymerase sigma factor (TIGR02999 family)